MRRLSPDERFASLESRFFASVRLDGPLGVHRPDLGPCWPWTGAQDAYGYGVIAFLGRALHTHVAAWAIAWGELPPKGMRFRHFACDLRLCSNPAHVRPKVAVENVLGSVNLAGWHEGRQACIRGHRFDRPNILLVPGGWACRTCRKEVERASRRRP
jgi:hypothetical protein